MCLRVLVKSSLLCLLIPNFVNPNLYLNFLYPRCGSLGLVLVSTSLATPQAYLYRRAFHCSSSSVPCLEKKRPCLEKKSVSIQTLTSRKCVFMCLYTCNRMRMRACVFVCVCEGARVCMCMCLYMCMNMCMCVCMHAISLTLSLHIHTYIYIHI